MTMAYEGDGIVFPDNRKQVAPALTGFRNKIIDGDFNFWFEGTSQSVNGYGSSTMWYKGVIGSTVVHSRQEFTPGQTDVPGNPTYFSRTVVSSVAGAANYILILQRLEDVKALAGKTMTFSFFAKADAVKSVAIDFAQMFGTGGSPTVYGIGSQKVQLSTSWNKYSVTVDLPSVSGKTIGDGNYLAARIWFDAGSDYDTYTDSLGQQSGTFDTAQVQFEEGSVATEFEHRPVWLELSLCQKYYFATDKVSLISRAYDATQGSNITVWFPVVMRTSPTCTVSNDTGGVITSVILSTVTNENHLTIKATRSGLETIYGVASVTADARL